MPKRWPCIGCSDAAVLSGARPLCRARRDGGPVSKGQRLSKVLFVGLLLVLLFGGGAKMIVAGGAKSLNMADRLLGQGDGARLLLADQPYGSGPRKSLDTWVPDKSKAGDRLPGVGLLHGDRKSVVWGNGGYVRVDMGGRRIL